MSTRDAILDVAERLIQTRGYNGFSYQHIADELSVRKPSLHYHFRSKADLGAAVMQRYRERMEGAMRQAEQDLSADVPGNAARLLELYVTPYIMFARTPEKICLCGALTGEFPALPDNMQAEVNRFIAEHHAWLERLMAAGEASGDFRLDASPAAMARTAFASLQGALLMKRATGTLEDLTEVIETLRQGLGIESTA